MLNNSISCLQLRGVELFDNTKVICVLRDPRSTWVAWQKEWVNKLGNKKWSDCKDSVGAFIASYERCMIKFYKEYISLKKKDNILIINFEDFVLDINCQKNVLKFLDLNVIDSDRCPTNMLRPSQRTVFAHHNYRDIKVITRIKNELKDYCHKSV